MLANEQTVPNMTIFEKQPRRTTRILAVDDDPLQLRVLAAYLRESGYTDVTVATSADMALREIRDSLEPFDIFLLDIQMPGMNGVSLCRRIRTLPDHVDSVVIMISSLKDRAHIQSAFAAGAVDYITKPFDVLELTTRIRVACDFMRARRTADQNETRLTEYIENSTGSSDLFPSERISILGVPNVVDYLLLSNFILQMPLRQTFSAQAFAVRIAGFHDIAQRSSPAEIYQLLLEVARPLSDALAGRSYFISYTGSGTFVCVSNKYDWMTVSEIMDLVRIELDGLSISGAGGANRSIRITDGRRVRNSLFSLDRRIGLIHRAINEVMRTPAKNLRRKTSSKHRGNTSRGKSMIGRLMRFLNV